MPKVNNEYLEGKRDQILDATFDVCMSKSVYTVKMKDIIEKTGFSHGLVYRYIEEHIQKCYFSPKQTLDEINSFISVCFSGIERDLILTRCYPVIQDVRLDMDGLQSSLCSSVLFLLRNGS